MTYRLNTITELVRDVEFARIVVRVVGEKDHNPIGPGSGCKCEPRTAEAQVMHLPVETAREDLKLRLVFCDPCGLFDVEGDLLVENPFCPDGFYESGDDRVHRALGLRETVQNDVKDHDGIVERVGASAANMLPLDDGVTIGRLSRRIVEALGDGKSVGRPNANATHHIRRILPTDILFAFVFVVTLVA